MTNICCSVIEELLRLLLKAPRLVALIADFTADSTTFAPPSLDVEPPSPAAATLSRKANLDEPRCSDTCCCGMPDDDCSSVAISCDRAGPSWDIACLSGVDATGPIGSRIASVSPGCQETRDAPHPIPFFPGVPCAGED
eukprot:scaffold6956_cov131-Isochrysis_galbana.AAC.1